MARTLRVGTKVAAPHADGIHSDLPITVADVGGYYPMVYDATAETWVHPVTESATVPDEPIHWIGGTSAPARDGDLVSEEDPLVAQVASLEAEVESLNEALSTLSAQVAALPSASDVEGTWLPPGTAAPTSDLGVFRQYYLQLPTAGDDPTLWRRGAGGWVELVTLDGIVPANDAPVMTYVDQSASEVFAPGSFHVNFTLVDDRPIVTANVTLPTLGGVDGVLTNTGVGTYRASWAAVPAGTYSTQEIEYTDEGALSDSITFSVTVTAGGFPVVEEVLETEQRTGGTTFSANIDFTASTVGKTCVVEFRTNANVTVTVTGWEKEVEYSNQGTITVLSRVMDGSEPATLSIPLGTTAWATSHARLISGTTGDVEAAVSTTNDPPALTPTWGAADTLWLTAVANRGTNFTITATPAGFSNMIETQTADDGQTSVSYQKLASAQRNANVATLNPDAFGISGAWSGARSVTIAVRPD